MKNNVYVRSMKSIKSISITRLIFILPLILYGFYKNGLFLYFKGYISVFSMFKPLIIIFGSGIIGALINLFYEFIVKRNRASIMELLFSSFTIEYGVLIGCVMSINVNLIIYFSVLSILLFISKFTNNRINISALIFLIIYIISNKMDTFTYANIYESSKNFSYTIMDYFIGKDSGGIASTHVIFLLLALFGLFITNNNKTEITIASITTLVITLIIIKIFKSIDIISIIFNNNYPFIFGLIATDSVTSSYTIKGMINSGILLGILTAIISIFNPITAPFIAILVVSLLHLFIDKYSNVLKKA